MKSSVDEPTVLEVRNPCEMRSMDKGPRPNEAPRPNEMPWPNEMPGPKHARSTHVEPAHARSTHVEPAHVPTTEMPTSEPGIGRGGKTQDHEQCQSGAAQSGQLACHGPSPLSGVSPG